MPPVRPARQCNVRSRCSFSLERNDPTDRSLIRHHPLVVERTRRQLARRCAFVYGFSAQEHARSRLMNRSRCPARGCMIFETSRRHETRRRARSRATGIVAGKIREKTLARDLVAELLFEGCTDCARMAAIPQGAFAACKVRRNYDRGTLISPIRGKENANKESAYSARPPVEGWELTPLKYNSKLMNSIWGLYNRYSVHNFKKNTDADEGLVAAVWGAVRGHPPAANASAVAVETPGPC